MNNLTSVSRRTFAGGTTVFAFALLFFFQLYTLFVESMYRLSLIKLSMGWELFGVLFLLAPLVVVLLGKRGDWLFYLAAAGLLGARMLAPFVDVTWQIPIAGVGVACFLVLLCCAFTGVRYVPPMDPVAAMAFAVLASIYLRHGVGSTLDISMASLGATAILLMLFLQALCLALVEGTANRPNATFSDPATHADKAGLLGSLPPLSVSITSPPPPLLARCILLFTSVTFIYLVAWSPGVTCAWSGSNFSATIVIATVTWSATFFSKGVSFPLLFAWNVTFLTMLMFGIVVNTTAFPALPGVVAVAGADHGWQHIPLYTAIALSPVLAMNLRGTLIGGRATSARLAGTGVLIGVLILFSATLLLIFTNVWGYVEPISPWFRNKFFVPFASVGSLQLICLFLLRHHQTEDIHTTRASLRTVVTVMSALFLLVFLGMRYANTTLRIAREFPPVIRVLTYNMQQGSQDDGNQRYLEQLDLILELNPDIVLLQESDTPRPSGGLVDAPRLFADALNMYLYFGPKTTTGTFGTAILSRAPLKNPRTVFTYSDVDEVGTAVAEIDWMGQRILLINNHPAGSDEVKHAHIDSVIEAATGYDAVIAGGDFNFEQNSPYYRKMAERLRDTWLMLHPDGIGDEQSVASGFSDDPARFDMRERIDHIFVSDGFQVEGATYFLPPDSRTDHPAYICFIRPPGATPR